MTVKVRVERRKRAPEPPREPEEVTPEELARGLAAILTPATLVPVLLAVWRLGADLGVAQPFQFSEGPLSSWIVWLLIAVAMGSAVAWLKNRGRGGSSAPG
jgi:hypothetical protein